MIDLRETVSRGEVLVGTASLSGAPTVIELMGFIGGFDFIFIDTEHTCTSPYGSELQNLIRCCYATDVSPVVRTASNDPAQILKALDMGAAAVIVPHINTRGDAEAAVRAAFYAPRGSRSACPYGRMGQYGLVDWPATYRRGLQETLVMALVEEEEGVENIEEIVSTPGLDGVIFGPHDLAVSLGRKQNVGEDAVPQERARVYEAVLKAGLVMGDVAWDVSTGSQRIAAGCRFLVIGGDIGFVFEGCKALSARVCELKGVAAAGKWRR